MGIDRSQVYQGPCPCGAGEVSIEFCTPDHPWPTKSTWFDPTIICTKCAQTYAIAEQDQHYGLVYKREIIERTQRRESYETAQNNLMASPQVKEVINRLIELLDRQQSIAACHRLLAAHQLVSDTYGTFTKRWKGASAWVQSHIRTYHLERLIAAVGAQDEYISTAMLELNRLRAECEQSLQFHGPLLLDTSRYRK
jgi:hypothetical protein